MAQAQGKSISELGTAEKYMSPDDLALISQKQNDGTYRSKAVKKEALEKLTIAGNRDDADRSGATYGTLSFLDNSDYHWRSGYITNAYLTDGSNATQMVSVKKCNGEEQHATLAVVVEPDGHRYGYANLESFGVGPQPISKSGANVYIQGSSGSIELHPPEGVGHGGYIDFHYNGDTSNYTSRLIEDSSNFQLVSTNKNVVVKADDSGKQVILSAAANNAVLAHQPTSTSNSSLAIATVGWVLGKNYITISDVAAYCTQQGFISGIDDQWTERINLIDSMLSEQHLVLYVDQVNGDDGNNGKTPETPLKSISKAIELSRKKRFIGGASCYIDLLNDYNVDLICATNDGNKPFSAINASNYTAVTAVSLAESIYFRHPDLSENRYFIIQGYDKGTKKTEVSRKITVNFHGLYNDIRPMYQHLYSKLSFYMSLIKSECNLQIRNIEITIDDASYKKITGNKAENYDPGAENMVTRRDIIYNVTKAATAIAATSVIVQNGTKIRGFRWGVVGSGTISDCTFIDCTIPFVSRGSINIGKEYIKGYATCIGQADVPNASVSLSYGSTISTIVNGCCYAIPIDIYNGGSFTLQASNSATTAASIGSINIRMLTYSQTANGTRSYEYKYLNDGVTWAAATTDDKKKEAVRKIIKRLCCVDRSIIVSTRTPIEKDLYPAAAFNYGPGVYAVNGEDSLTYIQLVARWLGVIGA